MKTRFLANRLDAGIISGASGIIDFISGHTGYIADLYTTGSDGAWCRVPCSGDLFTCEDLKDCNVLYTTGDQTLSGTLTVTGYVSGSKGIFDWLSGNSGYMRNEFTVGTGDCVFIVTTGGDIGINTCDPKCDVDIYANVCHSSGNFTNYSGYISGQSGIFDWLSGNSGYMLNEFTVGTGDCTFIVTTGGDIGINTCDPKCDVDIYANVCHSSGNFTNYSGYISGQSGILDWLSGNSGYMLNEFTVGTGEPLLIASGQQVRVSGELWITGSDGAPCQVLCGSGGGGGSTLNLKVQDDGVLVAQNIETLNFATDLDVIDMGGGTVTVDSSAAGGGGGVTEAFVMFTR